jgi:hypothetical protein
MRIGIVWVTSSTIHSTTYRAIFHNYLKKRMYRLMDGMRSFRNLPSTARMTYGQEVTFYISLSTILLVFVSEFRG